MLQLKILDLFNQGKREEAISKLNTWLDQVQVWAESDPTLRRNILIEIARVDFYLADNDLEEAFCCLDAASLQAQQEGHFDLHGIAEKKIFAVVKVNNHIRDEEMA